MPAFNCPRSLLALATMKTRVSQYYHKIVFGKSPTAKVTLALIAIAIVIALVI